MRDQTLTPLVVFSSHEAPASFAPQLRALSGEGFYKGEREPAFIASASRFYASDMPARLHADGQESVLYLDNQRGAWLRFAPGYDEADSIYLGRWREVSKGDAMLLSGWTRLGERYFAAF